MLISTKRMGIVVNKAQNNDYLAFYDYNLVNKDEEYDDKLFKSLIFEFYFIEKSRLESFALQWPSMNSELPTKSLKIINHCPVNSIGEIESDYKLWGNIIHDGSDFKILIDNNNYLFKIFNDHVDIYYNGKFVEKIIKEFKF